MPFTVTHVAAAVPVAWLCGWRVPFSALAIGAMLPDVSAYFPALFDYSSTHSFAGILTHCVPMGLLCYYVYHALLKRPLVDMLPNTASERLRPWTEMPIDFSLRQIFAVIACVAFGVLTHVTWDAFTHGGRWGVEMFPALQAIATELGDKQIRWYSVMQHGSSIVLLPPLLLGFARWIRKQPRSETAIDRAQLPRSVFWAVVALMIVGMLMHFRMLCTIHPHWYWITTTAIAVKHGGAVTLITTFLYCCGMNVVWLRDKYREPYMTDDQAIRPQLTDAT